MQTVFFHKVALRLRATQTIFIINLDFIGEYILLDIIDGWTTKCIFRQACCQAEAFIKNILEFMDISIVLDTGIRRITVMVEIC